MYTIEIITFHCNNKTTTGERKGNLTLVDFRVQAMLLFMKLFCELFYLMLLLKTEHLTEQLIAGSAGIGFTPHVIDVKAGEVLI